MPWETPVLKDVRTLVRDHIRGTLPGADASVPNSVLRVMSDVQASVCHLNLQYIDWLALQLLPDTAEVEWLDRHGDIWLTNADGSTGRKAATLAEGIVEVAGVAGTILPAASQMTHSTGIGYETTQEIVLSFPDDTPTPVTVRALDPGVDGNQDVGATMSLTAAPAGVSTTATVVVLEGGTDEENDDDLRVRVLERIRQPPMGGALHDYVRWTKAVAGVTRAWCGPLEMGMGTVSVRFMCDELRADNDGFPIGSDIQRVIAYLDTVRPVAIKDYFVVAPIPQRVDVYIRTLVPDTVTIRAGIEVSLKEMLVRWGQPGQTIFASWKSHAIMEAPGVELFGLAINEDDAMPSPGHLPVLGDIVYSP